MMNQAIPTSSVENHLLCWMKVVHISKDPKFSADSTSEANHAIQVIDFSDAAHPFTILLQLSVVTICFYVYSQGKNEAMPKIHLTS